MPYLSAYPDSSLGVSKVLGHYVHVDAHLFIRYSVIVKQNMEQRNYYNLNKNLNTDMNCGRIVVSSQYDNYALLFSRGSFNVLT